MAQQFQQPQRRRNKEVYDDDTGNMYPSFYRPESEANSDLGDTANIDDALAENDRVMSSSLSSKQINDLESHPADGNKSNDADQEESNSIPFKKEDATDDFEGSRLSRLRAKARNLSGRAKAGIGGGIITGGIGISAFFGLGSFQAIHLSNILSLDQAGNEQSSDVRMNGLFRYARSGGNLGETRVSYLGSKKFASTQKKLAEIGITFDEDKAFGRQKGTIVEIDKNPVTKGKDPQRASRALATYYDVDQSRIQILSNGRIYIDHSGLAIPSARAINDTSVGQLSGGKIATWTKGRAVKNFYNLPSAFHPFKRADAKITQGIAARYEAKQSEKARKEGREYKSQTLDDARSNLKSKMVGAKAAAAGALLVTSGVCLARDAADDAITFNREGIVVPQALEAVDKIAIGAQQQSGMDFAPEQLDAVNKLMTDDDGKSIWEARALKAKTDPSASDGEDLPWDYGQAFSGGGTASTLKDLGGTAGAWACSPLGIAGQAIGGILLIGFAPFTGGSTAAVYSALKLGTQAAIGAAVMIGLQNLLTNALQDDAIPEDISGPLRGNLLAYGSRELANINARAAGGIELSAQESAMIDNQAAQKSQADFQSKSFFAKMFDAKDYRSVAGKLIDKAGSPKQGIKNVATSIVNIGPALVHTLRGLNPAVQAASTYDYGFNRYGIPQRILNNEAYDDPYDNADKVAALLSSDAGEGYIDRAEKCFGVTIAKEDGLWAVTPEKDVNPNSSEYEDANCKDAGDGNWDRMILFVKDSSEMEAAGCYLGEEDSCKKLGVTTEENICSVSSSTGRSISGMPSWAKIPIVDAPTGGAVRGNINMAIANIKSGNDVPSGLRILASHDLDFIGLNEVSEVSLRTMEASAPGYGAYRDTRDDGSNQAMGNVIMWKKDRWKLLDSGRIQLVDHDLTFYSGEPKDWNRYATWGVFERKSDGAIVPVVVTHMMTNPGKFPRQHGNPPMTRIEQYSLGMDILLQLVVTLSSHGPVLVAGDMNSHDDQGEWAAVPKMKAAGYNYAHDGAVVYIFYPKGTKLLSKQILTNVKTPGDSHPGAVLAKIDMNGAGPGSIEGVSAASTSAAGNCPDSTGDGADDGSANPDSVGMRDDYKSPQCENFRAKGAPGLACDEECVDFVKFRLKKHIDRGKFASLGNGKDVAAGLGADYGYTVNHTPAVNAVASWPAGGVPGSGANSTYGHTAMVSAVHADGSITVEQYNVGGPVYSAKRLPKSVADKLTYAHTEKDF